jgi:DNA repair exonuclease SbcCD ATPase subunit
MADVSSGLGTAERDAERVGKTVAALEARCESVEGLAERTRALRQEIEQRAHAVQEATKNLQHASELRQEAAATVQELDERAKRLAAELASADRQATRIETLSGQLEDRAGNLRFVEKRLGQFEERLTRWDLVEQEIGRSLDQLAARQSTVEALQADVDRMFHIAEKTATDIRAITAAQGEIDASRVLLDDVMGRLRETRDLASELDERRRQTTQAEERLARAEALLFDVRSSLEALQGQKVIVDQAVEKAGALRFLLKQAEGMIEGLREERDMTARVRAAVASVEGEVARAG